MITRRPKVVVSLMTVGAVVAASVALASTSANAAVEHVDNPYAGATQYVNQAWSTNVLAAAGRAGDATLAARMQAIANQPTAVWMDRIGAIAGNADGPGLRLHLDAALAQKQGSTPIVVNLVIYDLPGRDCYALASNGELPASDAGLVRYKAEYIDPIAAMLSETKYEGLRIAAVVEPDSLPNLVTNASDANCQQSAPYYRAGVKYALDRLHAIPNVYTYVDAAHSGWLGWESNAGPAAQLFAEVARSTTAGYASIDGFVTNTANTTPLVEPYLTSSTLQVGGNPVRSASYYEWNPDFDEADWTADLYSRLVSAGFPSTIGMLVDTSRNGWGGANRPTAVSTSSTLNTYVNESRVDRRIHRGAWCNPSGAGIGERPQATPSGYSSSHLDAFVWIKPPGESDGASTAIPNDQGKGFDRMCDPTFVSPKLANQLTGALPNAPLSGQWFEAQFRQLVTNAYPAITPGGDPDPTDVTAPSRPGTPTASAITSSSAGLAWSASTDNVGVTGYTVQNAGAGAVLATTTGPSTTLTGLSPATSYTVQVVARDAAGNVSAASASVTFTTASGPSDQTAPSRPGTPTASAITTTSANLAWTASTDNVGVTGYTVQNAGTGAALATTTGPSTTLTGLSPATSYTVQVVARDAAGNVSVASSTVTFATSTNPTGGACSAALTVANSWPGGFQAEVRVTAGATALTGWRTTLTLPAGSSIQNLWSGTASGSTGSVTVTNAAWNGSVAAGQTTSYGFVGAGSAPTPGSVTCAAG